MVCEDNNQSSMNTNTTMIDNTILHMAEGGMPVCPRCGETLHWESPWNADEVGLAAEEGVSANDAADLYSCPHCDSEFYVCNNKMYDASRF